MGAAQPSPDPTISSAGHRTKRYQQLPGTTQPVPGIRAHQQPKPGTRHQGPPTQPAAQAGRASGRQPAATPDPDPGNLHPGSGRLALAPTATRTTGCAASQWRYAVDTAFRWQQPG